MPKYAIVCVDDESVVLEGLNSQLEREFGKEYHIEMAQSGEEALEIFQEFLEEGIEIPVLVTDQKMPGMTGSELLIKVKEISKHTLSILLTGQAGADEVGEALNQGNLYRYMAKPWDRTDLIMTVQEAIKSYHQKREIKEKTNKLQEYAEHLEEMVQKRTEELVEEKEKAEVLLLNILPEETALELKENGVSPPRCYPQVSVLFTDFVGFTAHATDLNPTELVNSLERFFNEFDNIIESHGLEKIKTIGDSYMAAGGIPKANQTNACDTVEAAFEMMKWVDKVNDSRQAKGLARWEMRIGIHTGDLVAGVIGTRKFAYDVWGDAVNIASRMESHGQAGKINISQPTYKLIKDEYSFQSRGEIEVKHRGKMHMYFVEPNPNT